MWFHAVEKRTSEPLLYILCLPSSVCESAAQQPQSGQTCSFFHCLLISNKFLKLADSWNLRILLTFIWCKPTVIYISGRIFKWVATMLYTCRTAPTSVASWRWTGSGRRRRVWCTSRSCGGRAGSTRSRRSSAGGRPSRSRWVRKDYVGGDVRGQGG